jgi:hypothetical protein
MLKRIPSLNLAVVVLAVTASSARGQQNEAGTGFGLQGTFSALAAASTAYEEAPRSGSLVDGGFRAMLYPTWKLNRHWTFAGAYQAVSRPYYYAEFETQGHGVRGNVAQAYLSYSQVWQEASLTIRAGELSSAFGSFPLRYDDRDNPLVDVPMQYGYYGGVATLSALAGVEVDGTWKKWDARAQFVNSSPANPRSVFATEQYGSWAGGAGYTIVQGLRVGVSGYFGPYLDRKSVFYDPAEGRPRSMPASGTGVEAQWGHGHWTVRGEWQRFVMTYGPEPSFHERTGYAEAQRALSARWYVAARVSYLSADYGGRVQAVETVAGYRPGAGQIVKIGYEVGHSANENSLDRTLAVQFVTAIHAPAFARR